MPLPKLLLPWWRFRRIDACACIIYGSSVLLFFFICVVEIMLVGWIFHLTNDIELHLVYWQSALTTALIWPLVYTLLRYLRQWSGITQLR